MPQKKHKSPLTNLMYSSERSTLESPTHPKVEAFDMSFRRDSDCRHSTFRNKSKSKKGLVTDCAIIQLEPKSSTLDNSAKLSQLLDFKSELQTLQANYAIAKEKHSRASTSAQAQLHDLQQRNKSQPRH